MFIQSLLLSFYVVQVDIEETSSQETTPPQGLMADPCPRQGGAGLERGGSSDMELHDILQAPVSSNSNMTDKKLKEILSTN